jgi:hypothetical protein
MAILVQDSFNRANNATSLGVADTGQTWIQAGVNLGINTNQVASSASGEAYGVIDVGVSDGSVQAKHTTHHGWNKVIFRYVDTNNFLFVENGKIVKKASGAFTTILNSGLTFSNGSVVKVTFEGVNLKIYRDGVEIGSVTESFNSTSTKHGIGLGATSGRIDDLLIETLETGGSIIDAGTITISADSSLTSTVSRILTSNATLQTDTTFTASAQRILSGMSSISAESDLSAIASRVLSSNISLSGDSSLSVEADVIGIEVSINLSAETSLSVDGSKVIQGQSTITANGEVIATGSLILSGEVALMSGGELSLFMGDYYEQVIIRTMNVATNRKVVVNVKSSYRTDINI